jgi:hypothetical protein
VNVADIRYVPPSNTQSVPIYIGFDLPRTVFAAVVLAVLAVLAAYWPARRAARHSITESLGTRMSHFSVMSFDPRHAAAHPVCWGLLAWGLAARRGAPSPMPQLLRR